jgi:hypothetical protein
VTAERYLKERACSSPSAGARSNLATMAYRNI